MTIPVTGLTPVYGLEHLVEGEPGFHIRQKWERMVYQVETALQAEGVTPPAAADFLALVARVATLEGSPPIPVPYVNVAGASTGWDRLNTTFGTLRVWKQGRTAHLTGLVKNPTAIANGTASDIGRVPVGFRPPVGDAHVFDAIVNGSGLFRVDLMSDGLLQAANNTGASVAAGSFVGVHTAWSLD